MRERNEINDSLLPGLRYQRHNIFVVWDGMFPVAAVGVFSPVTKSGLSKSGTFLEKLLADHRLLHGMR